MKDCNNESPIFHLGQGPYLSMHGRYGHFHLQKDEWLQNKNALTQYAKYRLWSYGLIPTSAKTSAFQPQSFPAQELQNEFSLDPQARIQPASALSPATDQL